MGAHDFKLNKVPKLALVPASGVKSSYVNVCAKLY